MAREFLTGIKSENRLSKVRLIMPNDPVIGGQPSDNADEFTSNTPFLDLACSIMYAQTIANNAVSAAATADSKAVAAQNTANTANTAAKNADTKATNAQMTANNAVSAAATADGKAVAAQNTANTANTAAKNADTKATNAQTTANNAVSAAATADGKAVEAQNKANQVPTPIANYWLIGNNSTTYKLETLAQVKERLSLPTNTALELSKKIEAGEFGIGGTVPIITGTGIDFGVSVQHKSGLYINNAFDSNFTRSTYGIYARHPSGEYESWFSWGHSNVSYINLDIKTPAGISSVSILTSEHLLNATGQSTTRAITQKAATDAINAKITGGSLVGTTGTSTTNVMTQKATTDAINNNSGTKLGEQQSIAKIRGSNLFDALFDVPNNSVITRANHDSGNTDSIWYRPIIRL